MHIPFFHTKKNNLDDLCLHVSELKWGKDRTAATTRYFLGALFMMMNVSAY